eukprot:5001784-Pyramimonas_sp.AAC.1
MSPCHCAGSTVAARWLIGRRRKSAATWPALPICFERGIATLVRMRWRQRAAPTKPTSRSC